MHNIFALYIICIKQQCVVKKTPRFYMYAVCKSAIVVSDRMKNIEVVHNYFFSFLNYQIN